MRLFALLPAAVFATTAAVTQADEIPKRKPGLWELHWHSNDVTPSQAAAAAVPDSAKMCIDDTTDEKLAAVFDPCDPPLDFALFSPQFKSEVFCETDAADVKVKSRAKLTFTGDTAYRIDVRTRLEPALKGEDDYSGVREGKWIGACPANMRPGDFIAGDEPKINILDELKPDR